MKNFNKLVVDLREEYPERKIEGQQLIIDDVISVPEILTKLSKFISQFLDEDLEAFISPGTPAMQTAWYLIGTNFKNRIKLFQTREAKFSKDQKPERMYLDLESNSFPVNVTIAQSVINEKADIHEGKIILTKSLKPVYEKAKMLANTEDVGCLILGENGTGKENLAQYIHKSSNRRDKPFIPVNCAAFTDELLRSELFGHEQGAFTGAVKKKKGLFEEANGGTIFLDEIGDVTPRLQVSLLRVLQEKSIRPIGSNGLTPINVRVVAATNRNLEELCEQEKFRWDLFFRLSATSLTLPALRERGLKEIDEMMIHFNELMASKFARREKLTITREAKEALVSYSFRGNVRELENLFIQFYTFCDKKITLADLPKRIISPAWSPLSLEEVEKQHILKVYGDGSKKKTAIAKVLGCSRITLDNKLKRYGVPF